MENKSNKPELSEFGKRFMREHVQGKNVPTTAECIERLKKARQMVANMASERRYPRMQIPAKDNEENEDVFICKTLKISIDKLLAADEMAKDMEDIANAPRPFVGGTKVPREFLDQHIDELKEMASHSLIRWRAAGGKPEISGTVLTPSDVYPSIGSYEIKK